MSKWMTSGLMLALWGGPLLAADEAKDKERAEAIAAQRKTAEEQWTKVFSGRPFVKQETDNFLLFGSVEEKELEAIGKAAERMFPVIKKSLDGAKGELWMGKLTIHVFSDRSQYRAFVSNVQKRSVEKEESGDYLHGRESSYLVAGPQGQVPGCKATRYPLDIEVIRQLAAATLTKKAGKLPDWFVMGFSRCTIYRYRPPLFTAERQEAKKLIAMGKTARDVWGGKLGAEESQVLNGTLLEYLMYGPLARSFPKILGSMGEETPFEEALAEAKVSADAVDKGWRTWVR